jgi:hypothetical protein
MFEELKKDTFSPWEKVREELETNPFSPWEKVPKGRMRENTHD